MIDIMSVGNQKLLYKDHENIEFESLSFYIDLAKKAIAKFGKNFSSSLVTEMLNSEDAISNVANCIMMADWRWDEDRKGSTGLQKTKYSYRNQCALWAIKSYMSRKKNKKHKSPIHINNSNEDDNSLLDILCVDSHMSPVDQLIEKEELDNLQQYFDIILSSDKILSKKQSEYIKMYYFDNMTFADIGKKFNVTREAVRQGIKKAIEKIQLISEQN